MLSISQRKTPGTVIQQVMSAATGSPVRKKSLIQQEIARSAGYDSFEQAQALNNRSKMIMDKLWVERSPADNNNWVVRAINLKIVIDSPNGKVFAFNIDGELISTTQLPPRMHGFNFDESCIDFCSKFNKVIFSSGPMKNTLVIQRVSKSELSFSISGMDGGHRSSFRFSEKDVNQVARWMDDSQTARMLAECVMNCEDSSSVEFEANQLGFTGVEMEVASNTALWIFEKDKGSHSDIIDEIEPKIKAPKAMGLFAHLFLKHYYAGSKKRAKELCESMSLESEDLNDMVCRFKSEADWFLLTYCKH